MANLIKKPKSVIEGNRLLRDVVTILGISEENVRSYDHCTSREDLEFELYAELLQKGKSPEIAEELAREMSTDLWSPHF
ncbi:MAG TPA: hypothetical protein DCP92_14575 [Nitrospiraceae bacterium]|nr:hypothetical protein [Nitrospiraceae bacterium]